MLALVLLANMTLAQLCALPGLRDILAYYVLIQDPAISDADGNRLMDKPVMVRPACACGRVDLERCRFHGHPKPEKPKTKK